MPSVSYQLTIETCRLSPRQHFVQFGQYDVHVAAFEERLYEARHILVICAHSFDVTFVVSSVLDTLCAMYKHADTQYRLYSA